MPVKLEPVQAPFERYQPIFQRIMKDLPAENEWRKRVEAALQNPSSGQLWLGIFNEKPVSIGVIEDNTLAALVVHPATRGRGVGRQMRLMLARTIPALKDPMGDVQALGGHRAE